MPNNELIGTEDYTQYRGYMDTQNSIYYMQPYDDQTIYRVALTEELMNKDQPTEFQIQEKQQLNALK